MRRGRLESNRSEIVFSLLENKQGEWLEFFYTIVPRWPDRLDDQLAEIEHAERILLATFGIETRQVAAKRFFSSDLTSHAAALASYRARQETDFFFSRVEQPPVANTKLALLGLCLNHITGKTRHNGLLKIDTAAGPSHVFAEGLTDPDADFGTDVEVQTRAIFEAFERALGELGLSIAGSVLRTWIYTPHVDADYPGIVRSRKAYFDRIHLTPATHYIASTGIQGGSGEARARVSMDAYAVTGVPESRIRHIQAPDHLSPTHIYGVTFERATAIQIGDREFLFISGTASIDRHGEIVHPGDVTAQTARTLENISALLAAADFEREDLASMIVYLRDASDAGFVEPLVAGYAQHVPAVYVRAPVCRPGWLVEIEATAARAIASA